MIGYGMAKAAIHQLVKSLSDPAQSGLPEGTFTAAILPITLDTPMNRKWMPNAGQLENLLNTHIPISFQGTLRAGAKTCPPCSANLPNRKIYLKSGQFMDFWSKGRDSFQLFVGVFD